MTSKQLYGFTKDKACERSAWKRLWGTRNTELEEKYLSSLDYCRHATRLRLQPNAAAAWLHSSSQRQESAAATRPRRYHLLTGIAMNAEGSQSVRAMSCANPIPAWAHRRKSLPASRNFSVKLGHKIFTNWSLFFLSVWLAEVVVTQTQTCLFYGGVISSLPASLELLRRVIMVLDSCSMSLNYLLVFEKESQMHYMNQIKLRRELN